MIVAATLAMAGGAAFAQTKPAATPAPAASPAPAPAPAAPAAPAAAPAPAAPVAAAPTGPVKIDLIGLQSPWTKICGRDQAAQKDVCYTTRDFGQSADQPPTLAIAIYQMSNEEKRIARLLLPVALLLKPGFRMIIDKGEPIPGQYALCFPNGCFAEAELNAASLAALKKAQSVSVMVKNQANLDVTFNIPMKDFAAAFDGPAVDPKTLEQQSQELQKQLEEKAKQQGGAAAPAPVAAPAAPAK